MNTADIISEFGAFYRGENAQDNITRVFDLLYQPSITNGLFNDVIVEGTRWEATKASIGQVVQGFKKAWSPLDNMDFQPRVIDLDKLKIDIEVMPDELEETWLGFLTRLARDERKAGNKLDRTQWPFIRWFVENHLIPGAKQQMETDEYFWGVKTILGGNTAGISGQSMNGLNKKISDDIAGPALINVVPTGAFSATDTVFVQQIEDFVDQVHASTPKLANFEMQIMINSSDFQRHKRGFRALYGRDTDQSRQMQETVIDTNVSLVACPSMDNNPAAPGTPSPRIIMTYADNRVRPICFGKNAEIFDLNKSANPRAVQIYSDWYETLDFLKLEHVFVNQ